jgi:hypothetical protein
MGFELPAVRHELSACSLSVKVMDALFACYSNRRWFEKTLFAALRFTVEVVV